MMLSVTERKPIKFDIARQETITIVTMEYLIQLYVLFHLIVFATAKLHAYNYPTFAHAQIIECQIRINKNDDKNKISLCR